MDKEHNPMTYRQIKDYAERQGWNFSDGGFERDLVKRGVRPAEYDDDDPIPWGVDRWLTHEVLSAIRRNGSYEWPETLDVRCEFTVLQTGRYITEPRDQTSLSSPMPMQRHAILGHRWLHPSVPYFRLRKYLLRGI